MKNTLRRLALFLACLILLIGLAVGVVGEVLSRPANRIIGAPPGDLAVRSVTLPSDAGRPVAGWFDRRDYEARVAPFLERYLRRTN